MADSNIFIHDGLSVSEFRQEINKNFTDLQGKSSEQINFDKIQDNAVTEKKILNGSVTANKISNGSVTANKIKDNAVTENKIKDGSITEKKLSENINKDQLIPIYITNNDPSQQARQYENKSIILYYEE